MDWLATVDVPAMTLSQAVDKEKEGAVLADVLMALKDSKVKMLFRGELFNMMTYWGCRELNTALDRLSEPVSPFSAYDPNDESAAKVLLSQAFDEYQGTIMPNTPPDVLFTRDLANRTYVCFRHSGNWEYHGHNIPTSDPNIPDYIKRKYNIWK